MTSLFLGPDQSKQLVTMVWQMETFWCMMTRPFGAPMIFAIRLPQVTGISHQPSSQARMPLVAQTSANSWRAVAARRGMGPSEWLIM